jgi:hypothetical protein
MTSAADPCRAVTVGNHPLPCGYSRRRGCENLVWSQAVRTLSWSQRTAMVRDWVSVGGVGLDGVSHRQTWVAKETL